MDVNLVFRIFSEFGAYRWDTIETDCMKDLGNASEPCEASECDFWSIFLHKEGGGRICIADVPTKEIADGIAQLLYNAVNQAKMRLAEPH